MSLFGDEKVGESSSLSPSFPSSVPLPLSASVRVHLCLPSEAGDGSVEYKWKLLNKSVDRVDHLTTQMNYRLTEGGGQCRYQLGVLDNGYPEGLKQQELNSTLSVLQQMASSLGCESEVLSIGQGAHGQIAELLVKRVVRPSYSDVRVAVVGVDWSGKSTMIGVLCEGVRDNGGGSARIGIFRHRHEIESGHTAAVSTQLLGFTESGQITNHLNKASPSLLTSFTSHSWAAITSKAAKIISFYDLVGHDRGQKVTIAGLLNESIDYVAIVISATAGVAEMDREHLQSCLALQLPIVIIITKIDLVHPQVINTISAAIEEMVTAPNLLPSPKQLIHITNSSSLSSIASSAITSGIIPLFTISSVTGTSIDRLSQYLFHLPPYKHWDDSSEHTPEFSVDSLWEIDGVSIVGGLLLTGQLRSDQQMLIGPVDMGSGQYSFQAVTVTSIQVKRTGVDRIRAGQTASLALTLPSTMQHSQLRKGLGLVHPSLSSSTQPTYVFDTLMSLTSPPDPLQCNYEPILYMNNIRQSATLLSFTPILSHDSSSDADGNAVHSASVLPLCLTAVDYAMKFRFCYSPELLRVGMKVIIREGKTRGIGQVTHIHRETDEQRSLAATSGPSLSPLPTHAPSHGQRHRLSPVPDGAAYLDPHHQSDRGSPLLKRRKKKPERRNNSSEQQHIDTPTQSRQSQHSEAPLNSQHGQEEHSHEEDGSLIPAISISSPCLSASSTSFSPVSSSTTAVDQSPASAALIIHAINDFNECQPSLQSGPPLSLSDSSSSLSSSASSLPTHDPASAPPSDQLLRVSRSAELLTHRISSASAELSASPASAPLDAEKQTSASTALGTT